MDLLKKTNVVYLSFTALMLAIAGVVLFYSITHVIFVEIDEKMLVNKDRIVQKLKDGTMVLDIKPIIEIELLSSSTKNSISFADVVLYDPIEDDDEPFRELTAIENIGNKTYKIILRRVVLESHDYFQSIGWVLIITLLGLLAGFALINRYLLKKTWAPFYKTLAALKAYSLADKNGLDLSETNIHEFSELNKAVVMLSRQIQSDYHSLKEFTQNAAHEIQTPLAIVQAKMEEILQSPELTASLSEKIQVSNAAISRLARLNRSLLLLTKIENHQFQETKELTLDKLVEDQLSVMSDFITAKHLNVSRSLDNIRVHANPHLVDTLLSNLIGNAIKHNLDNGSIHLELEPGVLTISNSGSPLTIPTEKLFERFSKSNTGSESLGLGLAICQQICLANNWRISYETKDDQHIVSVRF